MFDAKEMQKRLVRLTGDEHVEFHAFKIKEEDENSYIPKDGPWAKEPSRILWTDPETKFPCEIVRNHMGCLCGYVSISNSNPMFEKGYYEVEHEDVVVHGGLTYAEKEGGLWQLGFDCGHAHIDIVPSMLDLWKRVPGMPRNRLLFKDATYRDIEYVIKEIQGMTKQLIKLEEDRRSA